MSEAMEILKEKEVMLNSFFEMVEDLKFVVDLDKKENPNLPVFIIGY